MIGRLVVAALFVTYLVGQAPHLVHHLFDHDEAQAECTFLAAADRHHAVPADAEPVLVAPMEASSVAPTIAVLPISYAPGSAGARAPPAIV